MDNQQMQKLVDAVLGSLFVELEASGRHVHVTFVELRCFVYKFKTENKAWSLLLTCQIISNYRKEASKHHPVTQKENDTGCTVHRHPVLG